MATLQITSAREPFTRAGLASEAVAVLERADAMGLLPAGQRIETLDLATLRQAIGHIRRAGIGRALGLAEPGPEPAALAHWLGQLGRALEESPAPEREWGRLGDVLGPDLLARLVGISPSSLRRYRAAARTTPDDVAARLHFLALVAGDLAGAYSDVGIRRWFDRKRVQLGGRTPAELLHGAWDPDGSGPRRVRELARALVASPGT